MNFIPVPQVTFHGERVGYRRSTTQSGVWFVATLDDRGERRLYLGQVERVAGAYHVYEYPTPEAAAEGAQDAALGDASTVAEAVELFAAGESER